MMARELPRRDWQLDWVALMSALTPASRVALVLTIIASLGGCSGAKQRVSGSSLVVLVDFSQSFVPLSAQDERALRETSAAISRLARQTWDPPVAFLWSRIQSASLVSTPLCGPFQYQESLIKLEKDDSAQRLEECTTSTVRASADAKNRTPYTDISGAVALAADQGESVPGSKYLIIISDFMEDLPPGAHPASFRLHGERVLLLHRTGTDRTPSEGLEHLDRVRTWSKKLRAAGASSVVSLPLGSITRERVMRALAGGVKKGTDVVVLQNLPDTARPEILRTIAETLIKAARDWESPVTVSWADIRDEPNPPDQMPPLELSPHLTRGSDDSANENFPLLLNECASGMERFWPGARKADIGASIEYYAAAGAVDAKHIVLIISSFPDLPSGEREMAADLSGVRVVMLPAPNGEDAADESGYENRLAHWQERLSRQHANVRRIPFNGLTTTSLSRCIYGH